MARAGEKIYEWDKQPRMPVPPPRRGAVIASFTSTPARKIFRRGQIRPIHPSRAPRLPKRKECTERLVSSAV